MSIKSVAVYGGGAETAPEEYRMVARELGYRIGQEGLRLVYGGQTNGLLGPVADGSLSVGGQVLGVISEELPKELWHFGLTELRVAPNFQDRKREMEKEADAFIILPGSLATLDEAFNPVPPKRHGAHDKPILLFNYQGFWDPLITMIDRIAGTGFAHPGDASLITTVSNCNEAIATLQRHSKTLVFQNDYGCGD